MNIIWNCIYSPVNIKETDFTTFLRLLFVTGISNLRVLEKTLLEFIAMVQIENMTLFE